MEKGAIESQRRSAVTVLWLLTVLFSLRVAGQMLQRWLPQRFLPPFQAFQGSHLPYWILLPAQLLILALMVRSALRIRSGALRPSPRIGRMLFWAGGVYMALALTRLGIGTFWRDAPHWFHSWIPDLFHVVLAGYVLVLAAWHAVCAEPRERLS